MKNKTKNRCDAFNDAYREIVFTVHRQGQAGPPLISKFLNKEQTKNVTRIVEGLIQTRPNIASTHFEMVDAYLRECSKCKLPEYGHATWEGACQHALCRLCLKQTLFECFKGDFQAAADFPVFCPLCQETHAGQIKEYLRLKQEWHKRNPNRGYIEQSKEFKEALQSQDQTKEKDPPPYMALYCQIRFNTIKKAFPRELDQFLTEKKIKMLQHEKSITVCKICKKDKTEMISWTPCHHVECMDCAISRFEKLLRNKESDRDSLVCHSQDMVCYKDICTVLKGRLDLLSLLDDQKKYNYYERQDYCPHCEEILWIDKHHLEQRCFKCNYEFCSNCLLAAHEGVDCLEKRKTHKKEFENHKTIVKEDGEYFRTCKKCGVYARRLHGPELDIVMCNWCPHIFCLKHNAVPKLGEADQCCEGLKHIYF